MILTFQQLRDLAASVGFPDPTMAAAVSMGESGGHSDAANFVTPSQAAARSAADPSHPVGPEWSLGLWQINNCAKWQGDACVSTLYDQTLLFDPTSNAQVAYSIWQKRGWSPWGAYTSGSYRKFLPAGYVPPASQPVVRPPQRRDDAMVIAIVAGLSLAAAAGYAAFRERRTLRGLAGGG
jgi:hypothetical protein